jgi:hypothetical protein
MRRALAPLAIAALAAFVLPSGARGVTERGSYPLTLKPAPAFYALDALGLAVGLGGAVPSLAASRFLPSLW